MQTINQELFRQITESNEKKKVLYYDKASVALFIAK